jgi:hypothetical protein
MRLPWMMSMLGATTVAAVSCGASPVTVAGQIKVGRGPHGLCVYPQPGRYSLGHTGVFR